MINLKNIIFGILLITIPLLFTFLLFIGAEYYLKYKAEEAGIFYKFNNERIINLREQSPGSVIFTNIKDESGKLTISGVDDQGFLLPKSKHKDPDLTLAFLGGSTTYLAEVQPKDRFHYLIGNELEKRLNIKVNSLNAGVSGADTSHTINILYNKVLPKNPDYVLIMHAINDLNKLLRFSEYWNSQSFRQLVEFKYSFGNSLRYFKNRYFPHTYLVIRPILNYFLYWNGVSNNFKLISGKNIETEKLFLRNDEWKEYREKKLNFDEALILRQFRSAQLTAVTMAQIWGATPILLIQPNLIKKPPSNTNIGQIREKSGLPFEEYQRIYQKFLQTIRNIAKESNILIVDLDQGIPSSPKYFADIIHVNTTGSKMAAQLITNVLEKEISKCMNKKKNVRCIE